MPFLLGARNTGEKEVISIDSRGQPKKFKSGKELISLFSEFCESIVIDEFATIPSQTEFCRWLKKKYSSVDRKTVYTSLNKYFPTIKKEFERLQSDVIAQGGMLGKYQSTMSIFVLKNWCKWKDNPEEERAEDNSKQEDMLTAIKKAVQNDN